MSGPSHTLAPASLRGMVRKSTLAHLGGFGGNVLAVLAMWHARSNERAALAAMDARELHDLGLTRTDVAAEADKPFWRA